MKLKAVVFVGLVVAQTDVAQKSVAAEMPIPGAPVSPPSDGVGTGLSGSFFAAREVNGSNDPALTVALQSRPSVSFLARLVDYGNDEHGGQILPAFMGAGLPDPHARNLSPPAVFNVNPSVFRFTGYINITKPTVNFAINSDDGSRLSIGGVTIIEKRWGAW